MENTPLTTWLGFLAMCIGMFMAILDVQVVATSLPTIQNALAIDPDQMSWIQTAYLISEVIAIPLTGFLTRALGMRRLFVVAILVFTIASTGCALSESFGGLVAWRVLQGFSGGTLIPSVFAAVFILFPVSRQGVATTIAGVLAVLAPTVGPVVGGALTEAYSWHWLFLINVIPGLASVALAWRLLPRQAMRMDAFATLDIWSLAMMAISLAALELALKEAPAHGWTSGMILSLLAVTIVSGLGFVARTLRVLFPVVDVRSFSDRNFLVGCILSFVLGIGLFGSVYLMPVYLAFVRGHDALEIGEIMLVTGLAQLATAPIAVALEQRINAKLLSAFGFCLFAVGLGLSAFQDPQTDFSGMLWPQIIRGISIMFCLLPPTRLALGMLEEAKVPDASGLFNLMRNLGGAIGIALIDTIIYTRAPTHGNAIMALLEKGDKDTASFVGIPLDIFAANPTAVTSPEFAAMLEPLVKKAAMVESINDAWATIAVITAIALLSIPFARGQKAFLGGERTSDLR